MPVDLSDGADWKHGLKERKKEIQENLISIYKAQKHSGLRHPKMKEYLNYQWTF